MLVFPTSRRPEGRCSESRWLIRWMRRWLALGTSRLQRRVRHNLVERDLGGPHGLFDAGVAAVCGMAAGGCGVAAGGCKVTAGGCMMAAAACSVVAGGCK